MVLGSLLGIAFDALKVNKLRTGLTLLGVVIGVTSVMTIISALEGLQTVIANQLGRLGSATFIVTRIGMAQTEQEYLDKLKRRPITMASLNLVEKDCTLCDRIAPRSFGQVRIKYHDQALRNVFVLGTTSAYADIVDFEAAQGRFLSSDDDATRRRVVYVGDNIREEFFAGTDPVGRELDLGGKKYTIIGVSEREASMFGQDRNSFVMVPLSVYLVDFGDKHGTLDLMIRARSVGELNACMDQVRQILRSQRHVSFDKSDDFDVLTADNILDMLNSFTRILRFALLGISSISLVVGGIVVMNIMMVSVTERTREIGIRKSLGARQRHILLQFLFESLLVTLTGGLIGIALGFVLARSLVGLMDMDIQPSLLAIFMGLSISGGVGLFFGIYPAMKASRLDPVKALSYE